MTRTGAGRPRHADERGSLPLALLAMIVVAGLVGAVVASTIAGERSVRFDQDFTGAVHVAEVGVAEALHQLNTGQLSHEDVDLLPVTKSGISDGEPYEWEADTDFRSGDVGPATWTVTSTGGSADGVTRTLQVAISDSPLFDLGAFSRVELAFSGGNTADSYNSSTGDWCTGNGRVGSNEDLDFGGSATTGPCGATQDDRGPNQTVDGVDLYDWEADPDPGRCVHSGGSNCDEENVETHDERIETDDDVEWMKETLGVAASDDGQNGYQCDRANSQGDMTITGTIAPADQNNGVPVDFLTDHTVGPGEVYAYCADTVSFEGVTELSSDADAENPVVFVVGERVEFPQGGAVNIGCDQSGVDCNNFDPTSVTPEAAALQIYSPAPSDVGASNADVIHAMNHAKIAGVVYAPRGSCGGTGNAQIDLFGSLVCSSIRNQGGWQFHYDDYLGGAVRTGEFGISRWSEQ